MTLSRIACDGPASTLAIGDTVVPPHRLRIATGYDDSYNLTPARLVRGHRGARLCRDWINHYVGMSHFFQLRWTGAAYEVDPARPLNVAAAAWHRGFAAAAAAARLRADRVAVVRAARPARAGRWKQRDARRAPGADRLVAAVDPAVAVQRGRDGVGCATSRGPSSASPSPPGSRRITRSASRGGGSGPTAGRASTTPRRPPLIAAETGHAVPPPLTDVRGTLPAAQQAYLDWLGGKLGAATLALRDAVRAAFPATTVLSAVLRAAGAWARHARPAARQPAARLGFARVRRPPARGL